MEINNSDRRCGTVLFISMSLKLRNPNAREIHSNFTVYTTDI